MILMSFLIATFFLKSLIYVLLGSTSYIVHRTVYCLRLPSPDPPPLSEAAWTSEGPAFEHFPHRLHKYSPGDMTEQQRIGSVSIQFLPLFKHWPLDTRPIVHSYAVMFFCRQ